ncbi:MAG: peptidyl-prolyl cis-trans isomerase [Paenisporosarcina sp.]|nr:peptidyl-prolyl cis-trans isomerase [Paenisporosarcina sp.]
MRSSHNRERRPVEGRSTKKTLKTKPVLVVLGLLLVGNLLWFIAWLIPNGPSGGNEEVASVDGKSISREDWLVAMEEQYGQDTLLDLVNTKVMETAADKYDIKVSEDEIDLELALIRSAQDASDSSLQTLNGEILRKKIRSQLILDKVLTKDIVISDEEIESFFKENQALYNIPTTYRTSMMILPTAEEAKVAVKELGTGSSFDVLARERSLDSSSASLGGDIGYITEKQKNMDPAIIKAATNLKAGEWSESISLQDGRIAVAYVEDVAEGKSFKYEQVKDHIKRELAIEQLPQSVSPEAFWKEFDTEWFYSE